MKKNLVLVAFLVTFLVITVAFVSGPAASASTGWKKRSDVGNGFGDPGNTLISALAVYKSNLYAGTWNIATGCEIFKYDGKTWRQVSPDGFGDSKNVDIHSLVSFKDYLYTGTDNSGTQADGYDYPGTGAEMFRSADGDAWEKIVGAGLTGDTGPGFGNPENIEIHALAIFGEYLYAGTNNFESGGEIWRSKDSLTWTKVVGTTLTERNSGGFGNPGNVDITAFCVFGKSLYAATWNDATGCEIWRSTDGENWTLSSADGFGNPANRMILSMASFKNRLYAGTWCSSGPMEAWCTSDGKNWTPSGKDGFGDPRNFRISALATDGVNLYAGVHRAIGAGSVWGTADGKTWKREDALSKDKTNTGFGALLRDGNKIYAGSQNEKGAELWEITPAKAASGSAAKKTSGFCFGLLMIPILAAFSLVRQKR